MKSIWCAGLAISLLLFSPFANTQAAASDVPTAAAQNPVPVRRVEIKSSLSVVGGPRRIRNVSSPPGVNNKIEKTELMIEKKDGAYYFVDGDEAVDASLIAALAKALTEPANPEPQADDLGLTPAWLKANAPTVAQKFSETWIGGERIHLDKFEAAFVDTAMIDKAVQTLFHGHRFCSDCTRYFLSILVSVTLEDGTRSTASSSSELPYMLPWKLGNGAKTIAYNADISRAVAALMPEKSVNRPGLIGGNLGWELGRLVLREEEYETRLVDVENKTGGTLSAVRTKYTVESANFEDDRDPSNGTVTGQSNLRLRLKATDRPSNFSDDVALAYVDGAVVGADKFLNSGPQFDKLVLSVPWLSQYAENHPKVPMEVSFSRGASFSDGELKAFSADMRAIGREKVIAKVEARKDELVLLTVGSGMSRSEWLVFPDRHALLWRYWRIPLPSSVSESTLPAWSPSEYSAKPCAWPGNNLVHCVGREVSPSGILQPLQ